MSKVICLSNQKGGVGKSLSSVSISVELARRGYRVLAVDFDPQGNLTTSFGIREPEKLERTIATELKNVIEDVEADPREAIIRDCEGVDLLPSNLGLSGMEVALVNVMSRETVLRELLNEFVAMMTSSTSPSSRFMSSFRRMSLGPMPCIGEMAPWRTW